MKTFCCWSGGKESALSLYRTIKNKNMKIDCLLNMISEDGKRSRTHGIKSTLLKLQSDIIGIPIIQRKTEWKTYEQEFKKTVSKLKTKGMITGIFGDIDLQEHRDWVERVCKELNIEPILPLWKEKRKKLLKEFIDVGFKAIVVATNSNFLGKKWLGRQIDNNLIKELASLKNIDMCGEKGEYHTFVYDGPIFKKPMKFITGKKILKDNHWFLEIEK
ncbi:MAG: diphthine--ammonia ligase [Candidatus Firestonebacteria bacterium]